jgi:hypothetical protein
MTRTSAVPGSSRLEAGPGEHARRHTDLPQCLGGDFVARAPSGGDLYERFSSSESCSLLELTELRVDVESTLHEPNMIDRQQVIGRDLPTFVLSARR